MSTSADLRCWRAVRLVAVLVSACAIVLALVPPALAEPAWVGIGFARTDELQHGSFAVPVWTDDPAASISSVTATILDAGSPVTTVDLTQVKPGYWAPAKPFELTEDGGVLPHLGHYPIDVVADDSAGHTMSRSGAGVLDFTLRPQFAMPLEGLYLVPSRAELTFDHHDLTVHGRLEGVQPGSGDLVPLPSASVTVVRSYGYYVPDRPADTTWTLTTDADGDFTTPDSVQVDSALYAATYSAAEATVHGTATAENEFAPTQTAAVITAATDQRTVRPGHRVTIYGTVHRGSAKGAGFAGAPVVLAVTGDMAGSRTTVTADGAGHFRGTVTALASSSAGWSATTPSPFLTEAYAQGPLTVPAEAAYSGAHISLAPNGMITARGEVVARYHQDAQYSGQLTRLQYSRNGRTGWQTLASARNQYSTVTLTAGGSVDGYYRLMHPISQQLDTASTTPVHLHRTVTRFAVVDATPEPVTSGHTVTVKGTLQDYRARAWHAMAHRRVELFFLASGVKKWVHVTSGSTAANGRIALQAKATKTGRWLLQYYGDGTHFNTFATPDLVTVR